jgi:hypothetical protein
MAHLFSREARECSVWMLENNQGLITIIAGIGAGMLRGGAIL